VAVVQPVDVVHQFRIQLRKRKSKSWLLLKEKQDVLTPNAHVVQVVDVVPSVHVNKRQRGNAKILNVHVEIHVDVDPRVNVALLSLNMINF